MRRLLLGEFGADALGLDGDTADRLLAGRLDPADAPPGYAEVAAVLVAAAGPPIPVELAGEASAVATFIAMTRPSAGSRRRAGGRRQAFGSRLVALAAVAVCLLLVGGVAAAATGTLPGPARWMVDAVSRVAHHQPARSAVHRQDPGKVRSGGQSQDGTASVGHVGANQEAHEGRSASATPTGPDATGTARGRQCAAHLAGRAGVNGCKEVKPQQQSPEPEPSPQSDNHSASMRAPAQPTASSASGTDHRQKEGGKPGPEGARP
jgi:hypothetical protein